MLHIVNGDSVASKLKQGDIQGEILVWREVYPVGPVFADMAESGNRSVRAQYLERTLGIPQSEFINISETQEKTLQDFRKHKEIVLWFEHDLFDQTMLCYLLHWFAKQQLGQTKLNLLCIGGYPGIELFRGLGQLTAKQLEELFGTWQPVGRRELELGGKVWEAYASNDAQRHTRILHEDTSALPFVRAAFEAHLVRLPSTHNGLGSIEQTTLETVAGGINKPFELFDQAGNKLNILGMGDLEYWYRLAKMSEEPYPLLSIEGSVAFPNFKLPVPSFGECVITLTELGREVLAGNQDWAAVNRMDEWFGGLQFQGETMAWRWDASHKTVVKV
ncbi:DUF1835 domain-containing protein [Paenibacillus sp. sptzw28]|uniref:DUF1835 domain-containing protein n=1 Tax=Paenibacillus sp. sptzw28 TaxID=715179 RepID=UPI001C6E8269|nr:DUF1835 domain-containing protein [Paenibacillus sp. sptzw28]QYR20750.1 DUF1835 domain-containing protein [Paenibacillus sp. sptzw28]